MKYPLLVKPLLVLLCSFLMEMGFTSLQTTRAYRSDWKVFENEMLRISYPADWSARATLHSNPILFIVSPAVSEGDAFRENVTLLVKDMPAHIPDLDGFVKKSESDIDRLLKNSAFLENAAAEGRDGAYHKLVYTGDEGVFNFHYVQFYKLIRGKVFILTFTCEKKELASYGETGIRILESFQLKE